MRRVFFDSSHPGRLARILACGGMLALALTAAPARVASSTVAAGERDISVTLRRGTNVAAAVSPSGDTVVMDLHGLLFTLPARRAAARSR